MDDLRVAIRAANSPDGDAESAGSANSAPAGPTGAVTLRDSRHGTDVRPPTAHSQAASCTHAASDVFVILKAGRPAQASPLTQEQSA